MDNSIQPYQPSPLSREPEPASLAGEMGGGMNVQALLDGLRRRRWLIAGVWLATALPALGVIFALKHKEYTATAQIEVASVVPTIMDKDQRTVPNFDEELNTQAEIMESQQVLIDALGDPNVQNVSLLRTGDPLGELRRKLVVTVVPHTQLVQINVTQRDRDDALRLNKAIVDAYLAKVVGHQRDTEQNSREVLERKLDEYRATLDQINTEMQRLAETHRTTSGETFDMLRGNVERTAEEARVELQKLELQITELQERLRKLEGSKPGVLPPDLATLRQQMIETDAAVRYVQQELDLARSRLARLRSAGLPDTRQDVVGARGAVTQLEKELQLERDRAAADADKQIARRWNDLVSNEKARLQEDLASAQHHRDVLKETVGKQEAEARAIGEQALEMQRLRERKLRVEDDNKRVAQELMIKDIDSRSPGRISIASAPEVRPDGIQDKRTKLGLAALAGTLAVALGLGLLRDRADTQLHSTEQLPSGAGLRLLGAVPSVDELRSGLVTKDQFVESYRLICTSLRAAGPAGVLPKSILVTSALAAEGKTSLSVSLAFSMAEPGGRVLLVDGDIQAPQIAKLLKVSAPGDLRSVLVGERSIQEAVAPSGVRGVDVLIGRTNGATARGALNTDAAVRLIREAGALYEYVVIDSPPALGAADALVWSQAAEGVILSSLVGHSDRKALKLASDRLASVGARLLGSVIANVSIRETYYSYSAASMSSGPDNGRRTPPLVHIPDDTSHS